MEQGSTGTVGMVETDFGYHIFPIVPDYFLRSHPAEAVIKREVNRNRGIYFHSLVNNNPNKTRSQECAIVVC